MCTKLSRPILFLLPLLFACQSNLKSVDDNTTPKPGGNTTFADGSVVFLPDAVATVDKNPAPADLARVGCGNGIIDPGLDEACDDGNSQSGDGCTSDCKVIEKDHVCTQPGQLCTYLVSCGDGKIGGKETCDDRNTKGKDGCSENCDQEQGWTCPQAGAPCTPHCGDALLTGTESCDPPNVGKGCSSVCTQETGFICDPPAAPANPAKPANCRKTTCGDGKLEGSEACDDKNTLDGDGCSSRCTFEPDCSSGKCTSKCGDGIKLAPEECDDGNTLDGDGCSRTCTLGSGFTCSDAVGNPPSQLNLAATYRDFISFPTSSGTRHPDFEIFGESTDYTPNLVKNELGATGKPMMEGRCARSGVSTQCPFGQEVTTSANFEQWYKDTPGINLNVQGTLLLPRSLDGSYVFDSARQGFFPVDNKGFVASPAKEENRTADATVNDGKMHNFGFTTEIRYFFQYRGGEMLTFSGDDDLWIFINRRLALDLGGLHPRLEKTLQVDSLASTLGLVKNGIYEIALFHAERHSTASNFMLTLTDFVPPRSQCIPACGDGVVIAPEECDLGKDRNTGAYNTCTQQCKLGPRCGDGVVTAPEECDDGVNLITYSATGKPLCAPQCKRSGYCGDGIVDGQFGEQCDLGTDKNIGAYGGCTPACALGPRCGDGVVQEEFREKCDDSNTVSGDTCTNTCQPQIVL